VSDGRFLVVRAGGERFGVPLLSVREVVDAAPPRPVPAPLAAVRGVMPLRDRFYTLVHLGALVSGGDTTPPPALGETAVITMLDGPVVAFEVDDVEAVVESGATLVGSAAGGSSGVDDVWRVGGELVSVLDLAALAGRLTEAGAYV
jgi:chemotaxis signal transduction protein